MGWRSRLVDFLFNKLVGTRTVTSPEPLTPRTPLVIEHNCYFYIEGPDGVYELPLGIGHRIMVSDFRLHQSDFGVELFECAPKSSYH